MIVGKLKEAGVDLHLAREHALEFRRLSVPSGDLQWTRREVAIVRNHAKLFLPGKRLFAQLVPALIELPFVLTRPFFWHMMRCVRSAGCKIHEEWLVAR